MFNPFKKPPHDGPDFSAVDSQEKAEAAFRRGELEKLFLMPLALGGADVPPNTLYVPLGVAGVKADIDANVVGPLAAEGAITDYRASPQYQGASFVPTAIDIVASGTHEFRTTIRIWGDALAQDAAST